MGTRRNKETGVEITYRDAVDVAYTTYKCTSCGAKDSDRTDRPPTCLTCWSCGNGRNMSVQDQIAQGAGLFPYDPLALPSGGEDEVGRTH